MRLLVYEHVSGGGFADKPIPVDVISEGFGMLRTLISDFKTAGHKVTTTLDSRIAKLNPPILADWVVPISSSEGTEAKLREFCEQSDAVYLIAPETDDILRSLVELVEKTGTKSLNCSKDAIKKTSDKAGFYEIIRKHVHVPKTTLLNVVDDIKEVAKTIQDSLKFPVVFKPLDGISCGGVSVVKKEEQVARAVDKIKAGSSSESFLVQELIEGDATSVSLFSTSNDVVPVSLNRQNISLETVESFSSYNGGAVPFSHPLRQEVFEVAKKLVKSVPGLRGYIGIDFVLTDSTAVAIELNPRLTTSYVGLRQTVNFNPAQAIVDAVLKQELPTNIENSGFAYFSKVETINPTISTLQETYTIEGIVSPPFPVSENDVASVLISSYDITLQKAKARFREAKKRVLTSIDRGR